jgi:putative transposase
MAKVGDRFAALQRSMTPWLTAGAGWRPTSPAASNCATIWGPQYRSGHFQGSSAWLGIADDAAFLGEPETNGCAERWIRTLKE